MPEIEPTPTKRISSVDITRALIPTGRDHFLRYRFAEYEFFQGLAMLLPSTTEDRSMPVEDLLAFFHDYFGLPCNRDIRFLFGMELLRRIREGRLPLKAPLNPDGSLGRCLGIDRAFLEETFPPLGQGCLLTN